MNTKIWGSSTWHYLHCLALSYSDEPTEHEMKEYEAFFQNLILPCAACTIHYRENIKKMPPVLTSRKELFRWTVDLHNLVNQQTGKPEITYEQAATEIQANAFNNLVKTENLVKGVAAAVAGITVLTLFAFSISKNK